MGELTKLLNLSPNYTKNKETLNPFTLEKYTKKVLIFLISLFDISKLFINLKTKSTIFREFNILENSQKRYLSTINSFSNFSKLKVDPSLLEFSIEQLISKINIEDVPLYMWLNKIQIEKHKDREVKFLDKLGKVHFFKIFFEEKKFVCCRSKRKDEILKFSFKLLRKKMLFRFENNQKLNLKNQMSLKKNLKKKY